mgnify:FL=1|jgi:hypothetical protein|tara:strand:+ start:215 stop:469 length:255 start_codon:yes stop_codon:yes gene_type:complete
MNTKKLKELRRRVKAIQVEWLRELLPEEQASKITPDNVWELLPEQTHVFGEGRMQLSYMTDKWIMKRLKKYPHIKTYKELMEYK